MTPSKAKQVIKAALDSKGLPYTKLTARTVGFSDLARDSSIFVKIHGWVPNPYWDELRGMAKQNGFCIEA